MGMGYGIDTVLSRLGRPTDDIARYCFEEALEHISERDAYKVLTALAVLASGTTREMLGVIVGLDEDILGRDEALVELERLSLVTRQDDKWHLLPLVKQYALETCSSEYRNDSLLRAAESYCDFVHRHVSDERVRPIGRSAYDALEEERLNIFGLIEWCYENELWELVVQLVLGMGYFPHARGYWQDAIKYWGVGASAGQLLDDQLVFARCTTYLGYMHYFQGDFAEAEKCARRASLVVDELEPSYQLASVRRLQGYLATARGAHKDAVGLLNESLALMRQMKSAHGTSRVLGDLGELAYRTGDYAAAERHLSESLSIAETHNDRTEIIRGLRHLGELARLDGRCEEARTYYRQSLVAAQETGWWDELGQVKHGLAQLEWQCGNHELANELALEALAIYEQLGQSAKSSEVQRMLSNWETDEES
jgi:tetratricopeptide (TPR) repeat protein